MPPDDRRPEATPPPSGNPLAGPPPGAQPIDVRLANLQQQIADLLQGQRELLQRQQELTARIYALEQRTGDSGIAATPAAEPSPIDPGIARPVPHLAPPPLPRSGDSRSTSSDAHQLQPRVVPSQPGIGPRPTTQPDFRQAPSLPSGPLKAPAAAPEGLEATVGVNWINRIAVITLILGAGFLFKYGVDNNWLGPAARVLLGIACGGIALVSAEALFKRDLRVFAQGLTGLALALFYLSFWAAARLYDLIPLPVAFLAMSATTAAAGPLALRYGAQAVALLGLIGGYLTPAVLSTGESRPWVLYSYLFLLNSGGLIVARRKGWISIEAVSVTATSLYFMGTSSDPTVMANPFLGALFGLAFYAQFWLMHPAVWGVAQLAFPAAIAIQWGAETPALAWQIPFVLAGLAAAHLREIRWAPPWTLLASSLIAVAWLSDADLGQQILLRFLFLTLLYLPFLAWAPWRRAFQNKPLTAPDLTVLAGFGAAYFALAYHLLDSLETEWRGALALILAFLYYAASRLFPSVDDEGELPLTSFQPRPQDFAIALACTFLTLAIPIQFSGFRITMAWALEAAGLAWVGTRYRQPIVSGLAFCVIALTSAHIVVNDAWMYSSAAQYGTLFNLRMLTVCSAAAAAWVCAYLHATPIPEDARRLASPRRSYFQPLALLEYVDGHGLLLLGLALETIGWVDRNFTANTNSVTTVSLSIMLTVYAALTIGLGVQTRQRLHRIVGLILIATVILKLYLYDVWILGRLFRILAFLALGAILLAVSYLYSRYRHVLEKLWDQGAGSERNPPTGSPQQEAASPAPEPEG